MVRTRDFDPTKHPRWLEGASGGRGGEFREKAGVDWVGKLDTKMRERKYQPVTYEDLEILEEPAARMDSPGLMFGSARRHLSEKAQRGTLVWMNDSSRKMLADALRQEEDLDTDLVLDMKGFPTASEADEIARRDSLRVARDSLDQAIAEGFLTRPAILWRGIVVPEDTNVEEMFPIGAEVRDKAYMSTSFNRDDTASIIDYRLQWGDPDQVPVLLKVLAPAATSAAPGAASVSEMILARNLKTTVVGYEEITDEDRIFGAMPGIETYDGPIPVVVLEVDNER